MIEEILANHVLLRQYAIPKFTFDVFMEQGLIKLLIWLILPNEVAFICQLLLVSSSFLRVLIFSYRIPLILFIFFLLLRYQSFSEPLIRIVSKVVKLIKQATLLVIAEYSMLLLVIT
jgi:hypothetical protein